MTQLYLAYNGTLAVAYLENLILEMIHNSIYRSAKKQTLQLWFKNQKPKSKEQRLKTKNQKKKSRLTKTYMN